jgi:IS30 family transposase
MISAESRAQIRQWFFAEHWKIGTIAHALGLHPDTVRHALESERFHRAQSLRALSAVTRAVSSSCVV